MKKFIFTLSAAIIVVIFPAVIYWSCRSNTPTQNSPTSGSLDSLTVVNLITRAVESAILINETVSIAIVDREGNPLGVFNMSPLPAAPRIPENPFVGPLAKARSAAYLSSNQHAFTSLTGCFLTRPHYPPGVRNAPGGPLYGIVYSSIGGSDIQQNNGTSGVLPANSQPGLSGAPGGVPIYINGSLAGGIGVSFASDELALDINNPLSRCQGTMQDERIAFAAIANYLPPIGIQANMILLDGISLAYSNLPSFAIPNFRFTPDSVARYGTWDPRFPIRGTQPRQLADDGYITGYAPKDGTILSAAEVDAIVMRCVQRSNRTRAAIRRPAGSSAQVTISIADVSGQVLAIYRMADATVFGYDVAPQKARTSAAFSNPNAVLGQALRSAIGLQINVPLAVTTRTIGFLAQDYYPPGIDRDSLGLGVQAGPMWQGREFVWQSQVGTQPFGNGITIFPGGMPLYKNGVLAGGLGISGDGVDQDDYIAAAGAMGYEASIAIQADQFSFRGVRLPYLKYPRNPELP